MTSTDPELGRQGHGIFEVEHRKNSASYRDIVIVAYQLETIPDTSNGTMWVNSTDLQTRRAFCQR